MFVLICRFTAAKTPSRSNQALLTLLLRYQSFLPPWHSFVAHQLRPGKNAVQSGETSCGGPSTFLNRQTGESPRVVSPKGGTWKRAARKHGRTAAFRLL